MKNIMNKVFAVACILIVVVLAWCTLKPAANTNKLDQYSTSNIDVSTQQIQPDNRQKAPTLPLDPLKKQLLAPAQNNSNLTPSASKTSVIEHDNLQDDIEPVEADEHPLLRVNRERNEAIADKDWGRFVEILDQFEKTYDYTPGQSLLSAIEANAELWVFEDLLSRGAKFDYTHLLLLASSGNQPLTEALVPLGLDIHAVAPNGANAIHASITNFQRSLIITYFLRHQVSTNTQVNDNDPLALCLNHIFSFENSPRGAKKQSDQSDWAAKNYLVLFIAAKAQITSHHVEIAQKIKEVNLVTYEWLIKQAPLLGG